MEERLVHLLVQKLKKIISRPPIWLVVGVILTVITTLACTQLTFIDGSEWGGGTVRYGYPFNTYIVSSRHYWVSHETTVSRIFQPIQFMLNILFYSGSSYLVIKSAVFINNRIPLNILEKAGIIIVSPYFFLQALRRIAHQLGLFFRPIPTYGLHLWGLMGHLAASSNELLYRDVPSKFILNLSLPIGVIIFLVGLYKAIFIDNFTPLNMVQKLGIIIVTPYFFYQVIYFTTEPLAHHDFYPILGLRLWGFIYHLNTKPEYLYNNIEQIKRMLTQSSYIGGSTFLVGVIIAMRKRFSSS
jgi:hypothetical protein